MAAPYNPPKKGEDFIVGIELEDINNPGEFLDTPPLATGDAQVSKDFGTFANLATIPAVTPGSTRQVKVTISSTEMDADVVGIQFVDQTNPKAWADFYLAIPTTT